jgi:hypothetical protein
MEYAQVKLDITVIIKFIWLKKQTSLICFSYKLYYKKSYPSIPLVLLWFLYSQMENAKLRVMIYIHTNAWCWNDQKNDYNTWENPLEFD